MDEIVFERIKQLRKEKDLSLAQLAETLEIAPSSLSNYETGKRVPDGDLIIKMSKYFDCSTDYILGLSNFKKEEEQNTFFAILAGMETLLENMPNEYRMIIMSDIFLLIERCSKYDNPELYSKVFEIIGSISLTLRYAIPHIDALRDPDIIASKKLIKKNYNQFSTRLAIHQRTTINRVYGLMDYLTEQIEALILDDEFRYELKNAQLNYLEEN